MFNILYVSHEASLTGAPKCLYTLIKRINRKKYHPIFFSPCQGPLIKKLRDIGVETVIFKKNITLNLKRLIREKSIMELVALLEIKTKSPLFIME